MTRTDRTNKCRLPLKDRALALIGSTTDLIARDTRHPAQLALLVKALQAFKDNQLAHVIRKQTKLPDLTVRLRLYSELLVDLHFLTPKQQKYLAQRGIRYLGELFYASFDGRSRLAIQYKAELFGALNAYLGLTEDLDPLADGWEPPYWSDDAFVELLNMTPLAFFGDSSPEAPRRERDLYHNDARRAHRADLHSVGVWLKDHRANIGPQAAKGTDGWGVGKLKDTQSLFRQHGSRLWASVLIPPTWIAPAGVPETWTRLLEDVIQPAAAELERREVLRVERQRRWSAWTELHERLEEAHRNDQLHEGSENITTRTRLKDSLRTHLFDALTVHAPELCAFFEEQHFAWLGEILALSEGEFRHLLSHFKSHATVDHLVKAWHSHLCSLDINYPVVARPLPEGTPVSPLLLAYREAQLEAMSAQFIEGESAFKTHADQLRMRVDELELSVRLANWCQNSWIEYVWQLCELTEEELLRRHRSRRTLGRKSTNEAKDVLSGLGLRLGLKFRPETRNRLSEGW